MNDWTLHDDDPRDDDLEAECSANLDLEAQTQRWQREVLEQGTARMATAYRVERTSRAGRTVYGIYDKGGLLLASVWTSDHGRRWHCACGERACGHVIAAKASHITPAPPGFDGAMAPWEA